MKMKFELTLADAKRVAAAAEAEARRNDWNVFIAIVDDAGLPVYLQRLDGTQPASCEIAQHKARAAALFRRPTKALEEIVARATADLRGAYCKGVDLRGVDLSEAKLEGASFHLARISGAYFPKNVSAEELMMSLDLGTRIRCR